MIWDVLKSVRDLKTLYRERYSDLQMVKSEIAYTDSLVTQCTQELLADFGSWFISAYGENATIESQGSQESRGDLMSILSRDVNILRIPESNDEDGSTQTSIKSPVSGKRQPRRQV